MKSVILLLFFMQMSIQVVRAGDVVKISDEVVANYGKLRKEIYQRADYTPDWQFDEEREALFDFLTKKE